MIRYAWGYVGSHYTYSDEAQLNYVHRMSARVVFVLLWVHGGNRVSLRCMHYMVSTFFDVISI